MKLPVFYNNLRGARKREVRDAYIDEQEGLCCHCNTPLIGSPSKEMQNKHLTMQLFPPGFLKYPMHLHHSHETGMTIGVVHARCNGILWEHHGE